MLFESTTQEITTRLAPAAKKYELELTEVMSVRDRLSHAEVLQTRLVGLQAERSRIAGFVWKKEPKEDTSDILMSQSVESFIL